jgi:hypothetical protein
MELTEVVVAVVVTELLEDSVFFRALGPFFAKKLVMAPALLRLVPAFGAAAGTAVGAAAAGVMVTWFLVAFSGTKLSASRVAFGVGGGEELGEFGACGSDSLGRAMPLFLPYIARWQVKEKRGKGGLF